MMDYTVLIFYIYIFIVGICVGSFLNVCIYRIPLKQSIVFTPSHCMTCGHKLKWYENIPLFSWLFLRGKCSNCHSPISVQYPLIEALNGLLWLLVFMRYDLSLESVFGFFFVSVLLVISVIDAKTREIPPGTSMFVLVLGAFHFVCHLDQWVSLLIGFVMISGILLAVFLVSDGAAIGGGDVKLMAGTGLFLGWQLNLFGFVAACVIGSVIHLIRMRFFHAGRDLALGPYLSLGAVIAFLYGSSLIAWYIGLLGF